MKGEMQFWEIIWKTAIINIGKCLIDHYMHWWLYTLVLIFTKMKDSRANQGRNVFSVWNITMPEDLRMFSEEDCCFIQKKKPKPKTKTPWYSPLFFHFKIFWNQMLWYSSEVIVQKITTLAKLLGFSWDFACPLFNPNL